MENINWTLLTNHAQRELCKENIDWNNKDAVIKSVQQNGLTLEYASKGLQDDEDIVIAAVQQNGLALAYASKELRNDRNIVILDIIECTLEMVHGMEDGWKRARNLMRLPAME